MKILIADLHPEVQSALHLILSRISKVTEVCEAHGLLQLLAQCMRFNPDLILFDIHLAHPLHLCSQSLTDLIHVLRHLCPGSQLVAMSSRFEDEQEAMAAGANGYLSKTDPPDEVISVIDRFLQKHP